MDEAETSEQKPSEEALRAALAHQWQDHIQTRDQTWRALQTVAVVAGGLVGLGITQGGVLGLVVAVLVLGLAMCGMAITHQHRRVEHHKFTFIRDIERRLALHVVLGDPKIPQPFTWKDHFWPWPFNTSKFILWMFEVIFLFAIAYLVLKVRALSGR
jgi:hypothetical protein